MGKLEESKSKDNVSYRPNKIADKIPTMARKGPIKGSREKGRRNIHF